MGSGGRSGRLGRPLLEGPARGVVGRGGSDDPTVCPQGSGPGGAGPHRERDEVRGRHPVHPTVSGRRCGAGQVVGELWGARFRGATYPTVAQRAPDLGPSVSSEVSPVPCTVQVLRALSEDRSLCVACSRGQAVSGVGLAVTKARLVPRRGPVVPSARGHAVLHARPTPATESPVGASSPTPPAGGGSSTSTCAGRRWGSRTMARETLLADTCVSLLPLRVHAHT